MNVLLAAHFGQPLPRGHVLEKHPEWAMVPKSVATAALVASGPRRLRLVMEAGRAEGDVEGYYLSPSIPAVGDHLEARRARARPRLPGGRAPPRLHPLPGPELRLLARGARGVPARERAERTSWAARRAARRPGTTTGGRCSPRSRRGSRDAARVERPGLVLSAAVAPDEAQAVNHKFQDWPRWLASGVLTALCPMTYTPDNRLFQQQVESARERAGGGAARLGGDRRVPARRRRASSRRSPSRASPGRGASCCSRTSRWRRRDLRRLRDEAFADRVVDAARRGAGGGRARGSR